MIYNGKEYKKVSNNSVKQEDIFIMDGANIPHGVGKVTTYMNVLKRYRPIENIKTNYMVVEYSLDDTGITQRKEIFRSEIAEYAILMVKGLNGGSSEKSYTVETLEEF